MIITVRKILALNHWCTPVRNSLNTTFVFFCFSSSYRIFLFQVNHAEQYWIFDTKRQKHGLREYFKWTFNMFQVFKGDISLLLSIRERYGYFCFGREIFSERDLLSLCWHRFKVVALKLLIWSMTKTGRICPFCFCCAFLLFTFSSNSLRCQCYGLHNEKLKSFVWSNRWWLQYCCYFIRAALVCSQGYWETSFHRIGYDSVSTS